MKYFKLSISVIFFVGLIYLLNNSLTIGTSTIPPLGKFLSPYHGYIQGAERPGDLRDHIIQFDELKDPVEVIFDDNLVPHVYAQSIGDALFVQGYIQAKYRLWQIDISTRAAGGRLAEIMGERMLEYDQLQRRKGMVLGAERNVETWQKDQESLSYLQRFIDGMNKYINHLPERKVPVEFKLLDYQPESYSLLKVALYLKSMEQTLNSRDVDLESTNTLNWLGQELYAELYPSYNPDESPIIPEEVVFDFEPVVSGLNNHSNRQDAIGFLPHTPFEKPDIGVGSNNWAIHPDKTKSGNPIICNDPHLRLSLPSIWYEVHLHTPEFNVYGVTLPGFPGVIIGFNEHISWGMTNVGQDVADWYRIKWSDETKQSYLLDGKSLEPEYRQETYKVKNGSTIYDTITLTHWGPIVHENEAHPFIDLAYKWLPHNTPSNNQVRTFLQLAKAKDHQGYSQALETFASPAQNIVFGSKQGDIALRVTGKFPIRNAGQGEFVLDGSNTSSDWKGFIPFDHTPHTLNPSRGFVSSANQRSTSPKYPYPYLGGFSDFRGRMINRLLEEGNQFTVETMKDLQNNVYGLKAEEILPFFLEHMKGTTDIHQKIIALLQNWDYRYEAQQEAPIYFDLLYNSFYELVWDEMYSHRAMEVIRFPESWLTIKLTKEQPDHLFFDIDTTPETETAVDIVQMAFDQIIKELPSDQNKSWGTYLPLNIRHLANLAPFSALDLNVSGHRETINATYGPRNHGPSWRMIVELGDPINAYGIFPGGQSGDPSSKYYMNNIGKWSKGEYRKLKFYRLDDWDTEESLFKLLATNE